MARSRVVVEAEGVRMPRRRSRRYRRAFGAYAPSVRFEVVEDGGRFYVEELAGGQRRRWPTPFAHRDAALASVRDESP